jgi:GNAT superfamily N-acetyltransferase
MPADIPTLAAVTAQAFVLDPMVTFPFDGDAVGAEARLSAFFHVFQLEATRRGWLWTVDAAAAALWVPPDSETPLRAIVELATLDLIPVDATPERIADLDAFWTWVDAHHPDGPHWYLDHLAVAASRRGEGIGGALLEHGRSLAAADGLPAFLITDRVDNVSYYEARGFIVSGSGTSPVGGPNCWFLRADP